MDKVKSTEEAMAKASARRDSRLREMQKPANWSVWTHVPRIRLSEGVALSLGVEPASACIELPEYRSRMFLAVRNLASDERVPERTQIPLQEFSKWALSIDWNIPDEMRGITVDDFRDKDSSSKESTAERNTRIAKNRRENGLTKLIRIILEPEPNMPAKEVLAELAKKAHVETEGVTIETINNENIEWSEAGGKVGSCAICNLDSRISRARKRIRFDHEHLR